MLVEIKSTEDGRVIGTAEYPDIKMAIEALVRQGVSLARVDLSGMNLQGINIPGANLTDAKCERTDFSLANLSNVKATGINLRYSNLASAKCANSDFGGGQFKGATLCRADLRQCDLGGSVLNKADLSGANLSHAILRHALFFNSDLSFATLVHSELEGCDFRRAELTGVNLHDIKGYGDSLSIFLQVVRQMHGIEFSAQEWIAIGQIAVYNLHWSEVRDRFSPVMPHIFQRLADAGFPEWKEYWDKGFI